MEQEERVIAFLQANDRDGRLREMLRDAIRVEEANAENARWLGWEWYEVRAYPPTLMKLVINRIIKVSFKSNSATCYLLEDRGSTVRAMAQLGS